MSDRLVLPALLLATHTACAVVSHQAGMQTPALPLEPGGPVEAGASLGGIWHAPVESTDEDGDVSVFEVWDLHASAHVRVPLTWGTSLRTSVGTGRAGTSLAVSLFHPFRPRAPEARWQGTFVWGVGHRIDGASLAALEEAPGTRTFTGYHGVHLGLQGTAALGRAALWHLGSQANVVLFHAGEALPEGAPPEADKVLVVGSTPMAEVSVATGPAFFVDGPERRSAVYVMPELGVGFQLASGGDVEPVFVFQVSVGRTQVHRFGRR